MTLQLQNIELVLFHEYLSKHFLSFWSKYFHTHWVRLWLSGSNKLKVSIRSWATVNWCSSTMGQITDFNGATPINTGWGLNPDQIETQLELLCFTWCLFTPHIKTMQSYEFCMILIQSHTPYMLKIEFRSLRSCTMLSKSFDKYGLRY